jgi:fructose 1,6-bisphosphatase
MTKFRFRFNYHIKGSSNIVADSMDIEASGPIMALNQFHADLQRKAKLDGNRQVIRPRLKHDEYKLVAMHHIYHDAAFQRDVTECPIVEAEISLPRTKNPILLRQDGVEYDPANPDTLQTEMALGV